MLDGVKIRLAHEDAHTELRMQQRLRECSVLRNAWRSNGVSMSGAPKFTAKWKGWTFEGDATRCWSFEGSFHKFHEGGTNWKNYTFTEFVDTMHQLCETLELHPSGLKLDRLEIGVNIVPPIPTEEVLRSIVLRSNKAPMRNHGGREVRFEVGDITHKVYNKAKQPGYGHLVAGELLRVEIRTEGRIRELVGACGVRMVADLLDPAAWVRMGALLLDKFTELLIVEPSMPMDGLTRAQRRLVDRSGSSGYWQLLSASERSKKRKALAALYAERVPHGLNATLRQLIADKAKELCNAPLSITAAVEFPALELATFSARVAHLPMMQDPRRTATFSALVYKAEKVSNSGSEVPALAPEPGAPANAARRCAECGRDISQQDARSRYCSERIHGKEGKRCRNAASNRTLSLARMADRGPLLFDHDPFIVQHGRGKG